MIRGIQLTLMIGPAVPIPAPREAIEALQSVRVQTSTDGPSTFQLSFSLSEDSALHNAFLVAELVRVVIAITVNGTTEVLMDGVMTNREVGGGGTGGEPVLTLTGEDLTKVMDYFDFSGIPYPAMPDFARVALILAKYAVLGIIPMVIPSVLVDVPVPVSRIPLQRGKDLGYIRYLADQVGYVFYLDPGPAIGVSRAYWGPEIKVGAPQPSLNMDMDAHTNVESLSFSFDTESAVLPMILIQEPNTKAPIPIPVPSITPLSPPLGAIPAIPKNLDWIPGLAKYNPIQAALIGVAKAARSQESLRANGSLNVLRYGRVLKARRLVGVRGAGVAFDGLYYVRSVTHNLERGKYTQDFELSRNGLVSTVPTVPV